MAVSYTHLDVYKRQDHAWGWEPTTIEAITAYRPSSNSISSGQVLHCPYETEKAKLVVREMTDLLVLDLVDKGLVTDQMVLTWLFLRPAVFVAVLVVCLLFNLLSVFIPAWHATRRPIAEVLGGE